MCLTGALDKEALLPLVEQVRALLLQHASAAASVTPQPLQQPRSRPPALFMPSQMQTLVGSIIRRKLQLLTNMGNFKLQYLAAIPAAPDGPGKPVPAGHHTAAVRLPAAARARDRQVRLSSLLRSCGCSLHKAM